MARCWCFIWGKETFIRVSPGKTLKKNIPKNVGKLFKTSAVGFGCLWQGCLVSVVGLSSDTSVRYTPDKTSQ